MSLRQIIHNEQGYTLVESLVAMTLFVGVLIPFLGMLGNLLIDKRDLLFQKAIFAAESEINRVLVGKEFANHTTKTADELIVSRTIESRDGLIEIRIDVRSINAPQKELIVLRKTILATQ